MTRALMRKEWRQLRLLRWSAIAVGLVLPVLLGTATQLSSQGWLRIQAMSGYTGAEVIQEAMPWMLAFGVWPLFALMFAAQAFCGDRAAGTEDFLLQRPLKRSRIWWVRGLISLISTLVVFVSHFAIWGSVVFLWGTPQATTGISDWRALLLAAIVVSFVGTVTGAAASAFVGSPTQAVMLGAVLGAIPLGIAAMLTFRFPFAAVAGFRLGWAVPVLWLPVFLVSSFRALCKGEPGGRGRLRRGLSVLGLGAATILIVFFAGAPLATRWDNRLGLSNSEIVSSPRGDRAVVLNHFQRGGWLIDTASRRVVRMIAPPGYGADWNDEGTRFVLMRSGKLIHGQPDRLQIYDADGHVQGRSIRCTFCSRDVIWSGDRLAVMRYSSPNDGEVLVVTEDGSRHSIPVPGRVIDWQLIRPRRGEDLYVVHRGESVRGAPDPARQAYLRRVDLRNLTLGDKISIPAPVMPRNGHHALSPSGRYWIFRENGKPALVIDLETGQVADEIALEHGSWWNLNWIGDDAMFWIAATEETVTLYYKTNPGAPSRILRSGTRGWFRVSDERRRLVFLTAEDVNAESRDVSVFGPGGEQLAFFENVFVSRMTLVEWANESSLSLSGMGHLALQSTDEAWNPQYLIGGP